MKKLLFDFFPVLLFFVAYKLYDIYVATAVAIVAAGVQVGITWVRHRKVERMHVITLAIIVVLGGATLWLQDDRFIKWKPTAVNWLFALVFLGSHFIGKKPLIRRMMESQVELPDIIWVRLNLSWVAFFILAGLANLYVAFYFGLDLEPAVRQDIWVNFKLFGLLGLTVIFVIAQSFYLVRHMPDHPSPEEEE